MKNRLVILAAFLLTLCGATKASAQTPEWLHFGVEWGYSQMFFKAYHVNYLDDDGYRMDESGAELALHGNGLVQLAVTTSVNDHLEAGLVSGIYGSGSSNRLIPIAARASWFRNTQYRDGAFVSADAGMTFHAPDNLKHKPGIMTRLGGGYRVALGGGCSTDFKLNLRTTTDSPLLKDATGEGYIEEHNIRRNNAAYCALELSISVNF